MTYRILVLFVCITLAGVSAKQTNAQEKNSPQNQQTKTADKATDEQIASVATPNTDSDEKSSSEEAKSNKPKKFTAGEGKFSRWFELQNATITFRYLAMKNSADVVTNNQLHHIQNFQGRFKFDREGNYSINALVSTGDSMYGDADATGIGTGDAQMNLRLRHLYTSHGLK